MSRAINQLSPLEIPPITDVDDTDDIQQAAVDVQDDGQEESRSGRRSKRAAATKVRQRFADYSSDEVANVFFRFPQECHGVVLLWMILQYCYKLTIIN